MTELEKLFSTPLMETNKVRRHAYANDKIETTLTYHIVNSQIIALWLYDKIKKWDDINISNIILKILLHDMEETVTTDIPHHIKRFSKQLHDNIDKLSDACMKRLLSDVLPNSDYLSDILEDIDAKMFVKIIDHIDMTYTAYSQILINSDKSFLFIPAFYCMNDQDPTRPGNQKFYDNLINMIDKSSYSKQTKNYMKDIANQCGEIMQELYNANRELCDRINDVRHSYNYES